MKLLYLPVCVVTGAVMLPGCSGAPGPKAGDPIKLKVAYIGLTCEAPIFAAHEKGFFAEEGVTAELVRADWDGLREGLGLGRFDANHTLLMYLLKPIEQGLDIKITGGIHTGCLRVQVGTKSEIKHAKELKGKRIGIPVHLGSPPHLFASRVLAANGIDPGAGGKDIQWLTFPQDTLGAALEQGRVDAIATSDPIGTILQGMGTVRTIADQADDEPYREEYCCVVVVSGKLARENPDAAARCTRALFKAAKWVEENSTAAARLAVDKKYVAASAEMNAQALVKLRYVPGVRKCRESVDQVGKEMVRAGLLASSTDPAQLTKKAWLDLDGVTDAWIDGIQVKREAAGGRPERLTPLAFAALWEGRCRCCSRGCCLE